METNNFIDNNIVDLVYQGLNSIGRTVHKLNIRRVLDGTCGIVGASNEQTINRILEMYMRIKSTAHECVDIPYITALHGSLGDAIPASGMLRAQLIATKVLDESGIGYMDIPVDDNNFYRIVYNCIVTGQDVELSAYVKENCIKYCK